ncbi:MAG: response regulator transcription factor [Candidatus Obscuribacterales bacterium]|nr:response regulator transcription factor [Candidatus Obscuribacterales bacterium]
MAKILLADNDQSVLVGAREALESTSHTVESVNSGREALNRLRLNKYDLAVLDWSLPLVTGVDICRKYRANGGKMPILVLTDHSQEGSQTEGLDAGADDFLSKPFSMNEFLERVAALLLREGSFVDNVLKVQDLIMDTTRSTVSRAGKEIPLLPKEYALLEFFMRNKNTVFDIKTLLIRVWTNEPETSEDTVRQCLMRLRKKLDAQAQESFIKTVKGLGFIMEERR